MSNFILIGAWWYASFILSTVIHEAAHAWAALKLGDETAYEGGQVSLNPEPHIRREPFGMVVIPLLTYFIGGWMMGWASAPYDPTWAMQYPKRAALMALAGPVSNLCLAVIAGVIMKIGLWLGLFVYPYSLEFHQVVLPAAPGLLNGVAVFLSLMFALNILLFVFNMIPMPPLDGSGVLPLIMHEDHARNYMAFISNPMFMFLGIYLAWQAIDVIYWPALKFFLVLLYW
ncbi:MAG: site-2 protease family protein [Candidatus Omnitrophica bacterium]|nr:site-2 protease family protein [Candidatus Omnitrophota bacterium]MCB9720306.1 site-2 protease family protein [Candidatus Omnitrophota bacterium]